ncbi:unnamed protein product, partial [Sphacelaria rigidula]
SAKKYRNQTPCSNEGSNAQHSADVLHRQDPARTRQYGGCCRWHRRRRSRPRKDTTSDTKMGIYRYASITVTYCGGSVPLAVCLSACSFVSLLLFHPSRRTLQV